jgi:hypothetical protein
MVTQYVYDGFEGGMSEKECGDYITVEDYFDLVKRHDDFLAEVKKLLDDLRVNGVKDAVSELEAVIMAEYYATVVGGEKDGNM